MLTLRPNDSVDFSKLVLVESPTGLSRRHKSEDCRGCGKPTTSFCPKCLQAPFCSKKCLQEGAEKHSKDCGDQAGFEIIRDEKGCPYYAFTKVHHLPGSLLWIEDALVTLPSLPKEYAEVSNLDSFEPEAMLVVCFSCNKHYYPGADPVVCLKCGIFLCAINCYGIGIHDENECEILQKFTGRNFQLCPTTLTTARKYVELYLDLCVLRILAIFKRALNNTSVLGRWKMFKLLASTPRYKNFVKTKADPYDGIRYLKFLSKSVDVLKFSLAFARYDREIVQQVFKTMIVFWEENYEISSGTLSRALYIDHHFMIHNCCTPNVCASMLRDDDIKPRGPAVRWMYYLAKPVLLEKNARNPEEKLTFDFSGPRPHYFLPDPVKFSLLQEMGLHCDDHHSKSLTLDGDFNPATFNGSIRCFRCHEGLYTGFPVGETDFSKRPPKRSEAVGWQCNSIKCKDVQPYSIILNINLELYHYYMNEVIRRPGFCPVTDNANFIKYYEEAYLHPYHGIILQAKYNFLLAVQEKAWRDCGYNRKQSPLDPHLEVKKLFRLQLNEANTRPFPSRWDRQEFLLAQDRLRFSRDCLRFLDYRPLEDSNPVLHFFDYTFLSVENVTMGLLISCHNFLMTKGEHSESTSVLSHSVETFQRTLERWEGGKSLFPQEILFDINPTFSIPEEFKVFANLINKDNLEGLIKLILGRMKISQAEFLGKTNN